MDFLYGIHWDALFKIIIVDILLGGDNALVIAMACAAVPLAQRKKAIFYGTMAAIVMRGVILALASLILTIPFLKVVAGSLLLWIGYKLITEQGEEPNINAPDKLWEAIKTIAIADLVMSIDNVFAVTGAAQSAGEHSLIYAVVGILLSIPFIILGATLISNIINKYPIIIVIGAGMLGWIGAEMIISDPMLSGYITRVHMTVGDYTEMSYKVVGFLAVVFTALAVNERNTHASA